MCKCVYYSSQKKRYNVVERNRVRHRERKWGKAKAWYNKSRKKKKEKVQCDREIENEKIERKRIASWTAEREEKKAR